MAQQREAQQTVDELRTLTGFEEVTLSDDTTVRVRAYGFVEGMRVDALAGEFLSDLKQTLSGRPDAGGVSLEDIAAVFGRHYGVTRTLMAMALDRTEDYIDALDDEDGQRLMWAWWTVNRDFFTRRLLSRALAPLLSAAASEEPESPGP